MAARMREGYEYGDQTVWPDLRLASQPAPLRSFSPPWGINPEAVNNADAMQRELAEARFLTIFCSALYAQGSPKTVCAAAAQLLYGFFRYKLARFSFSGTELENATYRPSARTSEQGEPADQAPFPCSDYAARYLVTGGATVDPKPVTIRLPAGRGQLQLLEAQLGRASQRFLLEVGDCLAAALAAAVEKERLQGISLRDGLTGLLNRRAFEELLVIEAARRAAPPLSLVMIDIDDFKSVNDQFGHPAGDQVIVAVGGAIAKALRLTDLAARYGGEEFVVLLPDTTVEDAFPVAERLRSLIASLSFNFPARHLKVTASLGIAERCGEEACQVSDLLKLADDALYQAKRDGKNRTVIHAACRRL